MDINAVREYVDEVRSQYASHEAREHAYRPALQHLMRNFDDVEAINDPARSEHGAPDFIFQKNSNRDIILGYAEAKDIIGVNLDKVEKSEQMRRYAGYQNLYLTDYLEFRFYSDGEKYKTVRIGEIRGDTLVSFPEEYQRLINELRAFLDLPPQKISSGRRLAQIMGAKARRIRDDLAAFFRDDRPSSSDELVKIYNLMRTMLVHDLDYSRFADMYAQTLVYGLFVARYGDPTPDTFDREEARSLIPRTNPFLRQFFDHITGANIDDRLVRAINELCEVFRVSDVKELVNVHLRASRGEREQDPIIHFYEDFLKAYDSKIRKKMGAYYTPLLVVQHMVRHVDSILKNDFEIGRGIADSSKILKNHRTYLTDIETGESTRRYKDQSVEYHKVQILDPAVGTATFLNEIINFVSVQFESQKGRWPKYAKEDLVSRLMGFELMMAPYTIAHLKLGMTLESSGVTDLGERLNVYLTNTLEEGVSHQADLFSLGLADAVTEESRAAGRIKLDRPVMVIIGNPPYSGESSNKTPYADGLIDKYRFEPGGTTKLEEDNSKWLTDDYVKFISFAEDMVERNGEGVVAMITNHGYLNNPTFRGMRWHLTKTFDKIEIVDLHGNVTKREKAPDGSKDENVFNIQTGVAIMFAVRLPKGKRNKTAEVYFSEIWGSRSVKFDSLDAGIEYRKLDLDRKSYAFSPRENTHQKAYSAGVSVADLFIVHATGVVTKNDKLATAFETSELASVLSDFDGLSEEEIREKYEVKADTRDWVLKRAIDDVRDHRDQSCIIDYAYRPFDTRKLYFSGVQKGMVAYSQMKVMAHMCNGGNVALVSGRQGQAVGMMPWNLAFVTDKVSDLNMFYRGGGTLFPRDLFHEDGTRTSNISPSFRSELVGKLTDVTDDEIFDYVYGVLNSTSYRVRFKEFLKSEFPRVPVPADLPEFSRTVELGRRLRDLHLLDASDIWNYQTGYPVVGSDRVIKRRYADGNIYINSDQYFSGIKKEVWEFYVGGYQPAQKWLKDRQNRVLSSREIDQYQCLLESISLSIDAISSFEDEVPSWA